MKDSERLMYVGIPTDVRRNRELEIGQSWSYLAVFFLGGGGGFFTVTP